MWPWLIAALAGGVVLAHMSGGGSDLEVQKAVSAALSKEKDPVTLTTFALKLRAAGYDQYATQVDAKAARLHGISALPFTKNLFRNLKP